MPLEANQYWNQGRERQSQRLYVAFCEFASAALDYATGLDLLERSSNSNSARLNWASTAFYYSLVHCGRLVVFVAVGDFPTGHSDLPRCFANNRGATTDWLRKFVKALGTNHERIESRVDRAILEDYWRATVGWSGAQQLIDSFGDALDKARELRSENNYEALLIAHEFRHATVSRAFFKLAEGMRSVSKNSLAQLSKGLACYLESRSGWPPPEAKRPFFQRYVERRIGEPARTWFGKEVSKAIEEVLGPINDLTGQSDDLIVAEIERNASLDRFGLKRNLMETFEDQIKTLSGIALAGGSASL